MEIKIKKKDHTVIYVLKGEVKKNTLIELKEIIKKSVPSREVQNIEIDIFDIVHLDSLNLGEFMRMKKWLQERNIKFKLINPSERAKFLIESASFESFLLGDENY